MLINVYLLKKVIHKGKSKQKNIIIARSRCLQHTLSEVTYDGLALSVATLYAVALSAAALSAATLSVESVTSSATLVALWNCEIFGLLLNV